MQVVMSFSVKSILKFRKCRNYVVTRNAPNPVPQNTSRIQPASNLKTTAFGDKAIQGESGSRRQSGNRGQSGSRNGTAGITVSRSTYFLTDQLSFLESQLPETYTKLQFVSNLS